MNSQLLALSVLMVVVSYFWLAANTDWRWLASPTLQTCGLGVLTMGLGMAATWQAAELDYHGLSAAAALIGGILMLAYGAYTTRVGLHV